MRLFLQYQKDLPLFLLFFSTETGKMGSGRLGKDKNILCKGWYQGI